MVINTIRFGEVEVNESSIIHFEEGLSGLEGLKKYVVLNSTEDGTLLKWLQAVDEPHTALPIMNPFEAKNNYEIELDTATKETLSIKDSSEVAICSVVTVPDRITKMTTNLKSPIVINLSNNKGRQMIMHNSSYNTQHLILDEILAGTFGNTLNSDSE